METTDWQEPLTAAEVVDMIAASSGRTREIASAMVRDYLDETSDRLGFSVHRWGFEESDVEEIRRDYGWVDYERGESPTHARGRAAEYAAGWAARAATVDRDRSPGYAAHVDQEAAKWADRAQGFEPAVDELVRARGAVAAANVRDDPTWHEVVALDDGEADGWPS